jgi:hypothetical protein
MSLQRNPIRTGTYSPYWMLVPIVIASAVMTAAWLVQEFGTNDAAPVFVDSVESVPAPIEPLGA